MSQQFSWGSQGTNQRRLGLAPAPGSTASSASVASDLRSSSSSKTTTPASSSLVASRSTAAQPSGITHPWGASAASSRHQQQRNTSISSTVVPSRDRSRTSSISSATSHIPHSPSASVGIQQHGHSGHLHSSAHPASSAGGVGGSAGGQPLLYSAARGRTIPPSQHSQPPSAAAAQGGGAGGGSGSDRQPSRLSRASPSLSQTSDFAGPGSPQGHSTTSAPFSAQGGIASIDIAQLSIQLARIDKERDPSKLEESIKSLLTFLSSSMEVQLYALRKLIRQHSARINGNDTSDPAGSWSVLFTEVEAIRTKPEQAKKIADAIDINEGEPFRDFDISAFMDRFKLDPIAKCMLALAFKCASKADLKAKADAILSQILQHVFMTILSPEHELGDDLPPSYLATLIDNLLQNPPRSWNEELQSNLNFAVRTRYEKLNLPVPSLVMSTLHLSDLIGPGNDLVRLVQSRGERATSSLEACKDMLQAAETRHINYTQVASVLLYTVITRNGEGYNPAIFVNALKEHRAGRRLDWQDVVASFDREGLCVTKQQFLALYQALRPLALEYENFDIQMLWGGRWSHMDTQLSFVVAFLSCTADDLNAEEIPRLRRAFLLEDFEDAAPEVKQYAAQAARHPLVSLEATAALFTMIFQNGETYQHSITLGIPEQVINPHTPYFVVATAAVKGPWGSLQKQAFDQLFNPFLRKQLGGYDFVFHGLWKHDGQWLAKRLMEHYESDPTVIAYIHEHAVDHGFLLPLTSVAAEFGLDLACYAYGRGDFDIERWLSESQINIGADFPAALSQFIIVKARADVDTQKEANAPVQTVPLTIDTAYVLLTWLGQVLAEDILINLNRQAVGAYPRLINYGEGFDTIIRENSKQGNAMSPVADKIMQDHFKDLYNRSTDVKTMIEMLQRLKGSEDPNDQELFACMIQGLFDEYSCFGEYPADALATTAVLFGSIINFNLLSSIALQAGLSMVLEALQMATSRDDKMFKFGLQALMHFQQKLPEWPTFCEKLLSLPDLQGTEVFRIADDIVRSRMGAEIDGQSSALISTNGVTNGVTDEVNESSAPFTSLAIDPPLRPDLYREPDEDVQDRVIFAVNNLSDRNIDEKFRDIGEAITDEYHQWFAAHLVEDRAKSQPNYHDLFLKLLRLFNSSWLWKEVIRETIINCVKLLNADATLNNSNDRNYLKNLGIWLGLLTLARDKPIMRRNIAFPELLIEAHKTKRLTVAIPFVCKVLRGVAHSTTFKERNPWTAEVLSILAELYHHVEMKIQLKFEVEVLCKEINIDIKKIEPSAVVRESDCISYDPTFATNHPDNLEGFDLPMGLGPRNNLAGRFSAQAVISTLPDISSRLFYPPSSSVNQVTTEQTKEIFRNAAEHAIREIIFPVVERSVTIAGISASQLVMKDFATEPNEEKLKSAAHSMVKSLAGSLALVTCREPLRMSMSNNVRLFSRTLPGEGLPEGVIIMFVNDNIDIVCKVVEEAAEKQSVQVIDEQIQEAVDARRVYAQQQGDQPFQWPQVHRFARMMPEPFKPSEGLGGLSTQQLDIYDHFGPSRQHTVGLGPDRQSLDQLPAFDAGSLGIPTAPTPAGEHAIMRQGQPSRGPVDMPDGRVNGYGGSLEDLLGDFMEAIRATTEESVIDLPQDSPVKDTYSALVRYLLRSPQQAELAAQHFLQLLLTKLDRRFEIEVVAALLADISAPTDVNMAGHRVWQVLGSIGDEAFLSNPSLTAALLSKQLLPLQRVDRMLAGALGQRNPGAVAFFANMLDSLLFTETPIILRTDLWASIEALSKWVADDPSNEICKNLLSQLTEDNRDPTALAHPESERDQIEHVFDEWLHIHRGGASEKSRSGFLQQLHRTGQLKDKESTAKLVEICIDMCVQGYEQEELTEGGSLPNAYLPVDAFAELILLLVRFQGESDGAVKPTQQAYMEGFMSLIAVFQIQHFRQRGEHAKQKVFFRLYSNLLHGLHDGAQIFADSTYSKMVLTFGKVFLALQPAVLPAFTFSWMGLISHRVFAGEALGRGPQYGGWDMYARLLQVMLQSATNILPSMNETQEQFHYTLGIFKVLLLLHHDHTEFLVENHAMLVAATPSRLPQVKNLICSAYPNTNVDLVDPFTQGLKIDRLDGIRQSPVVRLNLSEALKRAGTKNAVDEAVAGRSVSDLIDLLSNATTDNGALIQTTVLYIVSAAIGAAGSKGPLFTKASTYFGVLRTLALELPPQARYFLLQAFVNQLRYPNSHTAYFSQALLEIFGPPSGETKHEDAKEAIAAVLFERLVTHRPHPWGLVVTFMELVKNKTYEFQGLNFVRENEDAWSRVPATQERGVSGLPGTQGMGLGVGGIAGTIGAF